MISKLTRFYRTSSNDELWMKIENEYYNIIKNKFYEDLDRFIKCKDKAENEDAAKQIGRAHV